MSASATLASALQGLQIVRIQMTHVLESQLHVGLFAGDVWRSVFGLALDTVSTALRLQLMAPDSGVKLWSLRAPAVREGSIAAGVEVRSEILLFGPLCDRLDDVVAAIKLAGELGFGKLRVKAELLGLKLLSTNGLPQPVEPVHRSTLVSAWSIYEQAALACSDADAARCGLRVQLITPLNIKHQNQPLRQAPSLRQLVTRILERAEKLCDPGGVGRILEAEEWHQVMDIAAQSAFMATHLQWVERARYSAAQQQTMPWGGLVGHIEYSAPAAGLAPWFAIAEWLQLGSKVTSGQGVIVAEAMATNSRIRQLGM